MPRKSTADVSAPGVTANLLDENRWKVVWHDKIPVRRSREFVFVGPRDGIDGVRTFVSEASHAITERGSFVAERDRKAVPLPPANLYGMVKACIDARTAAGKYIGKTPVTYGAYALRVAQSIHAITKIPTDAALPVTLLSRDLFDQVSARDFAAGSSDMMRYAPLRLLLDAWKWAWTANEEAQAAGRAVQWPHLPPAPRVSKDYLPRTPKYGRTIAPTLAHIDACIRHLPDRTTQTTRIVARFMRFTGLRISQVMSVEREDISVIERTLRVRGGRSESERSDARTVPLAAALLADPEVIGWLSLTTSGPIFPKRRHARANGTGARTRHAVTTFKDAWESATAADEVPRHVWAPPGRKITRPEHAFRAAFQAHLTSERVSPDVVDFLVGHEGDGVREVHYGRDMLAEARRAVDALPQIDWNPPGTNPPPA